MPRIFPNLPLKHLLKEKGCLSKGLHLSMHNHSTMQELKLCPEPVLTCMRSPK